MSSFKSSVNIQKKESGPDSQKVTFSSSFDTMAFFRQNANFRIFITLIIGRLNEAQRHRAVGVVEVDCHSVK